MNIPLMEYKADGLTKMTISLGHGTSTLEVAMAFSEAGFKVSAYNPCDDKRAIDEAFVNNPVALRKPFSDYPLAKRLEDLKKYPQDQRVDIEQSAIKITYG